MKSEAAMLLKAVPAALLLCSVVVGPASADQPPVALCQGVDVETDSTCSPVDAGIDDGSFDPDGAPITFEQDPPGPYDLGVTEVTLTVTDDSGASDSCTAVVTVSDVEAPAISCNVPFHGLSHRSAPISFTPTALDNCDDDVDIQIWDYECTWTNPGGQTFDRTYRCPVTIVDFETVNLGTPLIPFTWIEWVTEATDFSGNEIEEVCSVLVVARVPVIKP